jgi:hypothetical protein
MIDSPRVPLVFALSVVSGVLATDVSAQTCANPESAFVGMVLGGTTCGTGTMPTQNHGTILTPGAERVIRVSGTYGVDGLILTASAHAAFVFVCSGCGANAECVSSGESSGPATSYIPYPQDDRDYYVIVDGAYQCGDYSLSIVGPLEQEP